MREGGGGDDGGVLDADLVVRLVFFLEAAEDVDGVLDVGFADVDDLEAALEGGVFFDVLAVLVEGGGADGTEAAAGERGLEHVARVHGAFGGPGADEGVELVDEEDDLAVRLFDLLEHGFEAVFELSAELGSGDHGAEVEGADALVAEDLGDVAEEDAAGQAFDDGGLADTGLADEDGVVFGAAARTWTTRRISSSRPMTGSSLPRRARSVRSLAYFLERLELPFGVLVGDALGAADLGEGFEDGVVGAAEGGEGKLDGVAAGVGEGKEEVLGRDEVVLEVFGFLEGLLRERAGWRWRGSAELRPELSGAC